MQILLNAIDSIKINVFVIELIRAMSTFVNGEAKENDNTAVPNVPNVTNIVPASAAPVFYPTYSNYPPTSFDIPCGSAVMGDNNYLVKGEDGGPKKEKTVSFGIIF